MIPQGNDESCPDSSHAISLLKGLRIFLQQQRINQRKHMLGGNPAARPIKDLELDQAMNFDPWFKS